MKKTIKIIDLFNKISNCEVSRVSNMKKRFIMFFTISFLSMLVSINKVSAKMPIIPTEYGDYYTIIHTNNPDYNYVNDSYLTIKHDYVIYFNSIPKIYVGNYNQSDYITEYNPFGITQLKSFKNGTSSPKFKAILYANDNDSSWTLYNENYSLWGDYLYSKYNTEIYYTSVDIWSSGESTKFYEAGYMSDSYLSTLKSIKFSDSYACDKNGADIYFININFSDFINSDYKYYFSVNSSNNWIDITDNVLENPIYSDYYVYNNQTIYSKIIDSSGNLISSATYTFDKLSSFDGYVAYTMPKDYFRAYISSLSNNSSLYFPDFSSDFSLFAYDTSLKKNSDFFSYSIDKLSNGFLKYNLDLQDNKDLVIYLERSDYSKTYFTFYVPESSYVHFTNIRDMSGDCNPGFGVCYVDYDFTYKDESGNIINSSQSSSPDDVYKSEFFNNFFNGISRFSDNANFLIKAFSDGFSSLPNDLIVLFSFIVFIIVLIIIIYSI